MHRIASLAVATALVAGSACTRHAGGAPSPSGRLTFTRADSLADSTRGSRFAALGDSGTVTLVLDAGPEGCGVLAPSARYDVEGNTINVAVIGMSRTLVCHGPTTGPERAYAARIGGLSTGAYDLMLSFQDDDPRLSPLVQRVHVR